MNIEHELFMATWKYNTFGIGIPLDIHIYSSNLDRPTSSSA